MKKVFFVFGLLCTICLTQAQVVINPQLPELGIVLKSQLWSGVVINTSGNDMNIQIQVLLTDANNNQRILSGSTKIITLPKGITQLTASEVAPVTYNILSTDYNIDANPDGFLPVGRFNICYSVLKTIETGTFSIAEECETFTVEPIAPPQLVYPSDSDTLEIPRPLFQWLPPQPVSLFNNLTYDFSLVEVQKMQSSGEAIQQNIPLHAQQDLNITSLQYPVSLPELDTGKLYAWRITARSGGSPVSESETWTFKIINHKLPAKKYVMGYYAKLYDYNDARFVICDGNLKMEYQNQYNDKNAEFRIYDITTSKRRELKTDSSDLQLKFGPNLLQLNLSGSGLLSDNHIYLFELTNSKNEHWYLKFEFKK